MADRSQREACYNDPSLVLLTKDDFFTALYASQTNAAARFPTEAPSYAVTDLILSIHSAICKPRVEGSAVLCYPQARLEWHHPMKGKQWRDADFGVMLAFDRVSALDWLPSQPPRLLYVVEIKAPDSMEDWQSPASTGALHQGLKDYIAQISEQAYFGFRNHGAQRLHSFVIMGNSFAFFEYNKPDDLDAYIPPRKLDPSEKLAKELAAISGPRKRKRIESIAEPPAKMLEPNVIYAFEDVCDAENQMLGLYFRVALDMATAPHVESRQPSWFQVPSGNHEASEASLQHARDQIEEAADEVSGEALKKAAAAAAARHPIPDTEASEEQDPTFEASTWLEDAASALLPERNTPRSSRDNSVSSYKEDLDEETLDSEPGPSSSSSSLVNALGNLHTDDGAPPPPASSRPSSPIKRSAHYKHTNADPSSSAPATEEALVPKRKTRSAKKSDPILSLLTRHAQAEGQDKATKGKDTKGKGRAA